MMPLSFPLAWVVETSLQMSVLSGLLLCTRPWLRRFVGSGAVAGLWLLVAARLLLPWPVAAHWSLPRPWIAFLATTSEPAPGKSPAWIVRATVQAAPGRRQGNAVSGTPGTEVGTRQKPAPGVWNALWLAGLLLELARLAPGWRWTRRWAVQTPPDADDARLGRVFAVIPPALRRGVAVRLTDALEVPALAGVWRPCIWVPRVWLGRLDDEPLRHVLLHELGHAHRHDLLAQWLCALACCVHWFNPLVWWLARAARTDRELACDAWVLARGGMDEAAGGGGDFRVEYGRTLIRVASETFGGTSSAHRPTLGAVTMAAGRRQLGLRVREIGAFRVRSPWRGMVAGGITAGVAVAVIAVGRAVPAPEPPQPTPAVQATPAVPDASPSTTGTPSEEAVALTPAPAPTAGNVPGGQPAEAQVSVEAKIVSLSREAVRQFQEEQATSQGRLRQLADQLAAISVGQDAAKGAPRVNCSITQLLPKVDFDGLIRGLNQLKGVDLPSAPRVTTRSSQQVTVEITQDYIYYTGLDHASKVDGKIVTTPTKLDTKHTGVTLTVIPDIAPARDVVDLNVSWQMVNLEGWVRASDGQPLAPDKPDRSDALPVFVTQAVDTFITMPVDSVLVLGSLLQHPGTWFNVDSDHPTPAEAETLLLTFISLRLLDPSGAPSPTPSPTATLPSSPVPSPGAAGLPYGKPVPGKPGYVTSPYEPDAGYVDVHGFTRGADVRDPYTGKHFLVP